MGGGGSDTRNDTSQSDTEAFIRNIVADLMNKPAGQTEEDVIAGIWSSGKYFAKGEVWPIALDAS